MCQVCACYNLCMDRFNEITISVATLLKIALVGLGLYLGYFFIDLLLVVLTAIVIASAVEPAIQSIQRWRIPRVFAVLFVFTGVMAGIALIGYTLIPTIAKEAAGFINEFPTYLQDTQLWVAGQTEGSEVFQGFLGSQGGGLSLQELFENASETLGFAASGVGNIIGVLFGSVVNLLLIFVLAFYFAAQEYGIDNFLKIVIPPKHSKYAINLWLRSQRKIGLWMQGQLVMMLMTGTLIYVGLSIIGISYPFILKYAMLLALIAALSELIPVVGAIISSVPAVGIAFIGGGVPAAIVVGIFYLVYQQLQGNLIYPLVVNKVVGVPPMLVLIGLIVGAKLFGILGAILSVPLAAAFMEYIKDVEKQHAQEIIRRKKEEEALAEKIAEKVLEKTEEKEEAQLAEGETEMGEHMPKGA